MRRALGVAAAFLAIVASTAAAESGWCVKALEEARGELAGAEARHGTNSLEIVDPLIVFGDACFTAEDYESALPAYARAAYLQRGALTNIQNDLVPRLVKRVRALNGLGAVYLISGDVASAEKAYRMSATYAGCGLSPMTTERKTARNGVSIAFGRWCPREGAVDFHEKLLESCEVAFGKSHPETARVLDAQVNLYVELEELESAEKCGRRLVEMREKVLPENHPATAAALNKLAGVQHARKRYKHALRNLEEALEIRRHAFGTHHPKVALSLSNLASLRRDMGDRRKAEKLERAAAALTAE